jgi:hypothetical protein
VSTAAEGTDYVRAPDMAPRFPLTVKIVPQPAQATCDEPQLEPARRVAVSEDPHCAQPNADANRAEPAQLNLDAQATPC